jgi:drug/metabolite transporter (DMT)-like permease
VLRDPAALLGAVLALASAVLFGWANVDLRRAGPAGRGIVAVATSMWFALGLVALPVALIALVTGRGAPAPLAAVLALTAGATGLLLGRLAFFEAVALVGPSRGSMLKNASPVFVVVFAGAVLGEWPTPLAAVGIAAIVVGVLQHGVSSDGRLGVDGDRRRALRGLTVGIASAAAFAVGDVLLAVAVRVGGDPVVLGALVLVGGWLAAVLLAPGAPHAQLRQLRTVPRPLAAASVGLGVARLLSFIAIGLLFVPYVAAIVGTAPVLTAIIGRLRGGDEVLTARLGVSMVLVVLGATAIAVGG